MLTPKHAAILHHCANSTAKLWMLQQEAACSQVPVQRMLNELKEWGYIRFKRHSHLDRFTITQKGRRWLKFNASTLPQMLHIAKTISLQKGRPPKTWN